MSMHFLLFASTVKIGKHAKLNVQKKANNERTK